MEYGIDSHIRAPRSKTTKKTNERHDALFKGYADAYETVHIRRPTAYEMTPLGLMRILPDGTCGSEKRIRELTQMLKDRAKDR